MIQAPVAADQFDVDARIGTLEGRQQRREQVAAKGGGGGYPQRSLRLAGQGRQVGGNLDVLGDVPDFLEIAGATFGHGETARGPRQQPYTQMRFQASDALAHRGRAQALSASGAGDAARFHDPDVGTDQAQDVHGGPAEGFVDFCL